MNPISQRPICLEGRQLTYVLERKAVKNINLRVRPDLSIYVSAGPRVPIEHIEAFLQKQGPFIVKALDEYACRKALPVLTLRDGDGLYMAGTACTLDVRLGLRNTVRRRGRTVFMELADNTVEERRHLYHELLRREGEKLFAESLARIFPRLSAYGIAMPKLRQRVMRSRWGSCMPAKARRKSSTTSCSTSCATSSIPTTRATFTTS